MPKPERYSAATPKPTASAMAGVPASNLYGTALVAKECK